MSVTVQEIQTVLARIKVPGGGDLISRDLVRALSVDGAVVRFVIEAPSPKAAREMEYVRTEAEEAVLAMAGVASASVALTAHGPAPKKAPPSLKIGGHPKPQQGKTAIPGVDRVLAIGSGKGGVGKSTVSANVAVALARAGRRVGLLDADIYGPSQQQMMGVHKKPASPDGKTIVPLKAHGVTVMSIGFILDADKAVVWRGPMLIGALQQMLNQVAWGELDVLIVDLPPGTGDIHMSLCQKTEVTGAIVVSTPQDVAMLDARKALNMFEALDTEVLGVIENMSTYVCPKCGHEEHLFGHGGMEKEAEKLGVPLLGSLPLDLETRLAGDAGTPVAAGDGAMADQYAKIASDLIRRGVA